MVDPPEANPYQPPAEAQAPEPVPDTVRLEVRRFALQGTVLTVLDGAALPKVCLFSGEPGTHAATREVRYRGRTVRFSFHLGDRAWKRYQTARTFFMLSACFFPFVILPALFSPELAAVGLIFLVPFLLFFTLAVNKWQLFKTLEAGESGHRLLLRPRAAQALRAALLETRRGALGG